MDSTGITTISDNLLNRQVYSVCFTELDGSESFHNELFQLRKSFFTENIHKLNRPCEFCGYEGRVKGKIHKHSIKWKKQVNHVAVQEAFYVGGTYVVVIRDLNGRITGKIHFDKNLLWIKSEYFSADDYASATVIFKPLDTMDAIERFDYNPEVKSYSSTLLHPVPYMYSTAEQSVINAKHGDNLLLVSTDKGEFCYCSEEEKIARLSSIEDINSGTIMLLPAWEVREGEVPETAKNEQPEETPVFTDLFKPALIEAAESILLKEEATENPVEAVTPAKVDNQAGTIAKEDLVIEVEKTEIKRTEITAANESYNYTGTLIEGKREGRGRTDQPNGLTAFDGEYKDNKKNGFGSSYSQNGNLSYVGSWKDDKKDGVGVSFREKDHALHVCKWADGKPEGFTTLFDADGNLRYSGKIIDGKKTGVGISYRKADDTVFVGKWAEGHAHGSGTLFDSDGNLIYTGGWSDGKRNGTGTEFDVNGQIIYSGEWKDDKSLNGILYQKI